MKYNLPSSVSGYELTKEDVGFFSVIINEEGTNLVTNPTPTLGTTGYTSVNSTISKYDGDQYVGLYSIKILPTSSGLSGLYYSATNLLASSVYTFSCFIKGKKGFEYYLSVTDPSSSTVVTRKFISSGSWQRVWTTFTTNQSGTYNLYVYRTPNLSISISPFYVDGFQLEKKEYVTTYIDGNVGANYFNKIGTNGDTSYIWNSGIDCSASTRAEWCRNGGIEKPFSDYGFYITGIVGLGSVPHSNVMDQLFDGFGYYYGSYPERRTFTITGTFYAKDFKTLSKNKSDFISAISPLTNVFDLPIVIRYSTVDKYGNVIRQFDIECIYKSGLEGGVKELYQESVSLQFEMIDPYIKEYGVKSLHLGNNASMESGGLWKLSSTGDWDGLIETDTSVVIYCMAVDNNNGILYVGGLFGDIEGVANTANIAGYNINTGTWFSLSATNPNSAVYDMVVDGDYLYIVGNFTNLGDANGDYISRYKISDGTWNSLGTGLNGVGRCISKAGHLPGGIWYNNVELASMNMHLYVGGDFTSAGGVANTKYIAFWDPATGWSSLIGSDLPASVRSIINLSDFSIYVGLYNVGNGNYGVYRVDQTKSSWETVGGVFDNGGSVFGFGRANSKIYALGDFNSIGGVSIYDGVAVYTGSAWKSATTVDSSSNTNDIGKAIRCMLQSSEKEIYIGGYFNYFDGKVVSDSIVLFDGTKYRSIDADLGYNLSGGVEYPITIYDIVKDRTGNIFFAGIYSKADGTKSYFNNFSVDSESTAKVYPVVRITGSGYIWSIKNNTTGRSLSFSGWLSENNVGQSTLYLYSQGLLVMNFNRNSFGYGVTLSGALQEDAKPAIGSGTDVDFYLKPGNNNLSALITETDSGTSVEISYRKSFLSLDSAFASIDS